MPQSPKSEPKYTIDSSTLMDIFSDTPWISRKDNPTLWEKIEDLIKSGEVISHIEVYKEIKTDGKKGEELYTWAQANKSIFANHDEEHEGPVIRAMSKSYKDFVNDKVGTEHADPWLIAQAKVRNLTIITEEKGGIPAVCRDPDFNVRFVSLWELIKEQKWKVQVGLLT
jgi:hypothetical protein